MADDANKRKDPDEQQDGPTFDEVVRKMLNTPPRPKAKKNLGDGAKAKDVPNKSKGE